MIKKYLPQVLLRSGVSVAIRTGILYEIRKYFINENDLRIWGKNSKHKVVLRHHFISPSKGVNFLKAKPTRLIFVSATFISWFWRWISAWSKYTESAFGL